MLASFFAQFLSTFFGVLVYDTTNTLIHSPVCYDHTLDADFSDTHAYFLFLVYHILEEDFFHNPDYFMNQQDYFHALYWGLFREITEPLINTFFPPKYCE